MDAITRTIQGRNGVKMDEDFEKQEERKELEDSILEEILKPICDWVNKVLKGEE